MSETDVFEGDAIALAMIGYDERVAGLFAAAAAAAPDAIPGRVTRVDRGAATVLVEGGTARAELSTGLRHRAEYGDASALPAAGDWVALVRRPQHALDLIEAILPRSSAFIRRAPEAHGDSAGRQRPQVLAANVDVAFLVAAATDVKAGRLERVGVVAWESGATPVVVLTKASLIADPVAAIRVAEDALPDVPALLVDSLTGEGVDAVRAYLQGNRTAVFLGASGVGKSTLANALLGAEVLETGAVREGDGRGRHTTTARHLVPLPGGGALIDTPGIRAIQTFEASDGIDLVFADIEALAAQCRFQDCAHHVEPACAVQEAITAGELEAKRLERYRRIERERAHEANRNDPLAQQEHRGEMRRLNRWLRNRDDVKRKRGR